MSTEAAQRPHADAGRVALEALPDGCVLLDADGRVTAVNRRGTDLLGVGRSDLGRPLAEVVRLLDAEGVEALAGWPPAGRAPATPRRSPELELTAVLRGGLTRQVAVTCRSGADGAVVLVRGAARRAGAAAATFRLLADLAHDLRAPLASVQGFARTLLRRGDELDAARRQALLEVIDHDAARFGELLADLLELARLRAGRTRIRRTPVELTGLLAQHELTVADVPPTAAVVLAEPTRLGQVLRHLRTAPVWGLTAPVTVRVTPIAAAPAGWRLELTRAGGPVPAPTRRDPRDRVSEELVTGLVAVQGGRLLRVDDGVLLELEAAEPPA